MFKRNRKNNFRPFASKPRPSRKKRVLVGTVLALGAVSIAGAIEKGRDAQ